jgi:hypothetical protein
MEYTTYTNTEYPVHDVDVKNTISNVIEHVIRALATTPRSDSQAAYRSLCAPLLIKHRAHYKHTLQIKSSQRCGNLQRVSSVCSTSNVCTWARKLVLLSNKKLCVYRREAKHCLFHFLRGPARKLKLNYDRQSVGQSVLMSGTHLWPATNFSFS